MTIESEAQTKTLDAMEAERRLKLGRDLAKVLSPAIWINIALTMGVWLWNHHYIQFFWYAVLLVPAAIISMLGQVFEARKLSTFWANLFSMYIVLLLLAIPFFIPEVLLAAIASYALVCLIVGLLVGTKQLLIGVFVSCLGFIADVLLASRFTNLWFPPVNETISLTTTLALGIFAIITTGAIFYSVLNRNEQLYRQAQQANMESEYAKATAEDANRAKSVFLANMSHELRTPLNAILGFSQIMARDAALDATHHRHIEIINRSGEHLLGLINNVLDIAKIESGYIPLQERHFDLHKLTENVHSMFQMRASSKGIALSVDYAPDAPIYVQMDDGKLRQVLINLINNALKFTNTGQVVLRVSRAETTDQLHFEVEDTGAGIAPEELTVLFEPFSQTASGRQTSEGTGLGLPISRQFVRLMGGELIVNSLPGQGSIFSFDVPVHIPEAAEIRQLTQAKPRIIGLEVGQPAYRLLIVEDQVDSRQLLFEMLTSVGFEVRIAGNGQEAIAVWQTWQPQLIWMDMRLPILNGREATKQIKALPGGQETVIIALTASSFVEEREQILADGCNDFIRKPYREHEIFDALARHLDVRFTYENVKNESASQGQTTPLDLSGLPIDWLSQLEKATLEADAEEIQALAQQIRDTHVTIAKEIIRLSANFAYETILSAIAQAREST